MSLDAASASFGAGHDLSGAGVPQGAGDGKVMVVALIRSPASITAASAEAAQQPKNDIVTSERPADLASDKTSPEGMSTRLPLLQANEASSSVAAGPVAAAGQDFLSRTPGYGGGDSAKALLAQIMKCLPDTDKSNLPSGRLDIQLDAEGFLVAPPHVTVADPSAAESDMRVADRLVQAALQCGPYTASVRPGSTIALNMARRDVN